MPSQAQHTLQRPVSEPLPVFQKSSPMRDTSEFNAPQAYAHSRPWSIDRWGRLIAGGSVFFFTMMSVLHNYNWAFGLCVASMGLLLSALTDRCPIHWLLTRLGAREREDIFWPGGVPKSNPVPSIDTKGKHFK